jgi:hypothetical protein
MNNLLRHHIEAAGLRSQVVPTTIGLAGSAAHS